MIIRNFSVFVLLGFCILLIIPTESRSMDFKIFYHFDMKLKIVVAEGEIEDGDADRFKNIYQKADRDSEGDIVLVLNSPGGSVAAAFELAKIMEKVGVFTLVPDGAICASACASIVYVAGNRRDLLENGLLGFHTCYLSDGRTYEKSSICNEEIADHAISNNIDHASVSLFVDDYGPGEIAWVGREVACKLYGMCRRSLDPEFLDQELGKYSNWIKDIFKEHLRKEQFGVSPSFNCNEAKSPQEKIICDDEYLAYLDKTMAELYSAKIANSKNPSVIRIDQRSWLNNIRNICMQKNCLVKNYKMRIEELQ